MKRKRSSHVSSKDGSGSLQQYLRPASTVANTSGSTSKSVRDSTGQTLCTLNGALASELVEGYARKQRHNAVRQIAKASGEKRVTYPAALHGPDGTLIDMTTLVMHTGSRFLSRADLVTPEGDGGTKPLCPPDVDEAEQQRYSSNATTALLLVMNGDAPSKLPLDTIAQLFEHAQYYNATFVVSLLPYYLEPLGQQLNPSQASELLVQQLSAAQGEDATRAYVLMLQALAPCIASPSVSVPTFSAAALQLVTGVQALCEACGSDEVQHALLDLVGELLECRSNRLIDTGAATSEQCDAANSGTAPEAERRQAQALMCLVLTVSACCVCSGRCSDAPEVGSAAAAAQQSAAETVARSIARSTETLRCGPLRAHAVAALKLVALQQRSGLCSCRSAAFDAAFGALPRSPLEHVAADAANKQFVVAQGFRRAVLAVKLQLDEDVKDAVLRLHELSIPQTEWCLAIFKHAKHASLGLRNLVNSDRHVSRVVLLALKPDSDLSTTSPFMQAFREWTSECPYKAEVLRSDVDQMLARRDAKEHVRYLHLACQAACVVPRKGYCAVMTMKGVRHNLRAGVAIKYQPLQPIRHADLDASTSSEDDSNEQADEDSEGEEAEEDESEEESEDSADDSSASDDSDRSEAHSVESSDADSEEMGGMAGGSADAQNAPEDSRSAHTVLCLAFEWSG